MTKPVLLQSDPIPATLTLLQKIFFSGSQGEMLCGPVDATFCALYVSKSRLAMKRAPEIPGMFRSTQTLSSPPS